MADPGTSDTGLPELLAAFDAELRRVPDRLRQLSASRLAHLRDHARSVVQTLADTAAGIEARDLAEPPPRRAVPRLEDRALGDQLAVTGTDVLLAASDVTAGSLVWVGERRVAIEESVRTGVDALVGLRRA